MKNFLSKTLSKVLYSTSVLQNRRKAIRFKTDYAVKITTTGPTSIEFWGRIIEISQKGLCICISKRAGIKEDPPPPPFSVHMHLVEIEEEFTGDVVRLDSKFRWGVELKTSDLNNLLALLRLPAPPF